MHATCAAATVLVERQVLKSFHAPRSNENINLARLTVTPKPPEPSWLTLTCYQFAGSSLVYLLFWFVME